MKAKKQLILQALPDRAILDECYARVRRRYFSDREPVEVRWEIPPAVQQNGRSLTPAAALYPKEPAIVVHPALASYRCPQYVYQYLLYHESLHVYFPSSSSEQHDETFRKREMFAPYRKKSIQWLERHRFAVMQQR